MHDWWLNIHFYIVACAAVAAFCFTFSFVSLRAEEKPILRLLAGFSASVGAGLFTADNITGGSAHRAAVGFVSAFVLGLLLFVAAELWQSINASLHPNNAAREPR